MTAITYRTGDLMDATETAIAHGCNCQGVMGAGVARLVKDKYPNVYSEYLHACIDGSFQVGTAQPVWVDPVESGSERLVYNLGTQHFTGADASVWGVFLSFANMAESALRLRIHTVAISRIGAGIGGLDWNEVAPAIEQAIEYSNHPHLSVVVYDLPGAS